MNAIEWACAGVMSLCVVGIEIFMPRTFSDHVHNWAATGIGIFTGVLIVSKYIFDRWIKRASSWFDMLVDFIWLGFAAATIVGLSLFFVDDTRLKILGIFSGHIYETLGAYSMPQVRSGAWLLSITFLIVYGATAWVRLRYAIFRELSDAEQENTSNIRKAVFAFSGFVAFMSAAAAWSVYFLVNSGITA
tara:strand:+ start:327 stop:896 length:570 start_codon:yes stop_codon:yes gene_type:complete